MEFPLVSQAKFDRMILWLKFAGLKWWPAPQGIKPQHSGMGLNQAGRAGNMGKLSKAVP